MDQPFAGRLYEIEYDEYDEITGYTGTGSVVCIDLNQALASDPDRVSLAVGDLSGRPLRGSSPREP